MAPIKYEVKNLIKCDDCNKSNTFIYDVIEHSLEDMRMIKLCPSCLQDRRDRLDERSE